MNNFLKRKTVEVNNNFFQIPDIHPSKNVFETLSCVDRENNINILFSTGDYIPERGDGKQTMKSIRL